jgi:hypothetical protein
MVSVFLDLFNRDQGRKDLADAIGHLQQAVDIVL